MILSGSVEEARERLNGKILEEGKKTESRFGDIIKSRPAFAVIKNLEYTGDIDHDFWNFCGDNYFNRVENLLETAAEKLKASPFTRRISIPIWRPDDHFCRNPPAITEVSFIQLNNRLNSTAYFRSLDVFNYFFHNLDFLNYLVEEILERTEFMKGTLGIVIGIPHIYLRDLKAVEGEGVRPKEFFGYSEHGCHLVDDYLSSAWHSALETIYNLGMEKETEWGEIFEGQAECKFVHRLFIEVKNPYDLQIHDKAPFSRGYGIEYAHEYMIHARYIDSEVKESILKEGETYTYAERARYCEKDDVRVDQLYRVIQKLKQDRNSRDCYVGISREWDLNAEEPPCLRGYQFICNDKLSGIFYMRSNDAYGAMHANMFAFSTLTQYVAELTGFKEHEYFHFAVDAHIYSEFLDAVKEILQPETPAYSIEGHSKSEKPKNFST
ncbi:MAG TPA: thymidylate synthase [Archaeoglobaceae archaeon]|nr:thymidylate synthase [Archaeoglobaceae archaeon]